MNPKKPVILCVDDENVNLKLLEKLLVRQGYTAISATSGKEALLKIKSQKIDLVLLDIIMPGMDGFEVCRQIKEDLKVRDIPVILITVLTAKQDRIRGIEVGAEDFLTKPFDQTEALARIKILLKVKEFSDERQRVEKALKKAHDELEGKVQERTAELAQANEILQADILDRQKTERELKKAKFRLDLAIDASQIGVWELDLVKDTSVRNLRHDQIFGYEEKTAEWGAKKFFEHIIPEDRLSVQAAFDRAMKTDKLFFECRILWPDKSIHWITATAKTVRDNAGKPQEMIGTVTDITERKLAVEAIRSSLAEKEVLLKEVHHRVKNNLMTIIGLIKMQETKANNIAFNDLLQELESRVRAMALVHESLHKSGDLARIGLQNYIETLTAHIRAQYGAERDIRFRVQAAGVDVDLNFAIPCGLILNELVANAYKHAFPKNKPRSRAGHCEISVIVGQEGGALTLTVADNGVGLPAGMNLDNPETLGLQLVKMLSQQINGSIELDGSAGTIFHLRFAHSIGTS
jgi:PAS domain S-box-containing protein